MRIGAISVLVPLGVLALFVIGGAVRGQGPEIFVETPRAGTVVYGPTLEVAGTAANATRVEVCIVEASWCKNATTVSRWSVTFDLAGLSSGAYTLRACAYDVTRFQCAETTLSVSRITRDATAFASSYGVPVAAAGSGLIALAVALLPGRFSSAGRPFRSAHWLVSAAGLFALTYVGIMLLSDPSSLPLQLGTALISILLVVHWIPVPKEGS